MSEFVIIGGGISGLAAATLLAQRGGRVTLVERSRTVGGRARSDEAAGMVLNRGPHALYRQGAGVEVLAALGVAVDGEVPSIAGEALYQGGRHALPSSPGAILRTSMLTAAGRWQLARVMGGLRWVDTGAVDGMSLNDWLSQQALSPAVADFVRMMTRLSTYANAPDRLSAGAALRQLKMAMGGVYYLRDGWQGMVDGLARAAKAAGVDVVCGRAVELAWTGDAVSGVILQGGETLPAQGVVLAVGPAVAGRLLGVRAPDLSGLTPARLCCLDLVLSALPPGAHRLVMGIDEPLYLSVHATQPAVVAHAARYLAPGEAADVGWLEEKLDGVWPGWRERVLHRRALSGVIATHAIPTVGTTRPPVAVGGGVCLAGDWVGEEGILADAALASARRAAGLLTTERAAA